MLGPCACNSSCMHSCRQPLHVSQIGCLLQASRVLEYLGRSCLPSGSNAFNLSFGWSSIYPRAGAFLVISHVHSTQTNTQLHMCFMFALALVFSSDPQHRCVLMRPHNTRQPALGVLMLGRSETKRDVVRYEARKLSTNGD